MGAEQEILSEFARTVPVGRESLRDSAFFATGEAPSETGQAGGETYSLIYPQSKAGISSPTNTFDSTVYALKAASYFMNSALSLFLRLRSRQLSLS
jgi:hypothetical protein